MVLIIFICSICLSLCLFREVKKIGVLLYIKFRNQILERIKNRKGSREQQRRGRLQYREAYSEQWLCLVEGVKFFMETFCLFDH